MINKVSISTELICGLRRWATLAVFLIGVLGARFWFILIKPQTEQPVFFQVRREIDGYHFQNVPLGERVPGILATTNLLNGHFLGARANRISVFQASWEAGHGTRAEVLGHTPELCWVGRGFRVQHMGEPTEVLFGISDRLIPFQCRIFQDPATGNPEITIWAVSLDGRWDEIVYGIPPELVDGMDRPSTYAGEFLRALVTRWEFLRRSMNHPFTQSARKQFVRLSQPLTGDWQTAIQELEIFAQQWLGIAIPQ